MSTRRSCKLFFGILLLNYELRRIARIARDTAAATRSRIADTLKPPDRQSLHVNLFALSMHKKCPTREPQNTDIDPYISSHVVSDSLMPILFNSLVGCFGFFEPCAPNKKPRARVKKSQPALCISGLLRWREHHVTAYERAYSKLARRQNPHCYRNLGVKSVAATPTSAALRADGGALICLDTRPLEFRGFWRFCMHRDRRTAASKRIGDSGLWRFWPLAILTSGDSGARKDTE